MLVDHHDNRHGPCVNQNVQYRISDDEIKLGIVVYTVGTIARDLDAGATVAHPWIFGGSFAELLD